MPDCLVGVALGDALGSKLEGMSHQAVAKILSELDPWIWVSDSALSDDTLLVELTAESICEHSGFSRAGLALKLIQNKSRLLESRLGPTSRLALEKLESDPNLISDFGITNGAALRSIPLGIYCSELDQLETAIYQSATLTHGTDAAISAAMAVGFGIWGGIQYKSKSKMLELAMEGARRGRKYGVRTDSPRIDQLIELGMGLELDQIPLQLGNSILCYESIPAALSAFYLSSDPLMAGLRVGGDTDTIAAIAGALQGALQEFLPQLKFRLQIAHKLAELESRLIQLRSSSAQDSRRNR